VKPYYDHAGIQIWHGDELAARRLSQEVFNFG